MTKKQLFSLSLFLLGLAALYIVLKGVIFSTSSSQNSFDGEDVLGVASVLPIPALFFSWAAYLRWPTKLNMSISLLLSIAFLIVIAYTAIYA